MTPEDLELTVRLARWMGWTEANASNRVHVAGPQVGVGFEWSPLTDARHAAEVMAEAARRGLRVEATVCGASGYATAFACRPRYDEPASIDVSRHLFVDVQGGYHGERGNFAAGWCRAVCLAVLAAAEGGA